jgi:four helix bundle protein
MAYCSFEGLEVWQRGTQVAVRVYEVLKGCRDFGLKDQMTRSAVSIPSNIAEGAERDSVKEFIRFLHIAKGSAAELRTQMHIANRVHVVSKEDHMEIVDHLVTISRKIHRLIDSLKKSSVPKT